METNGESTAGSSCASVAEYCTQVPNAMTTMTTCSAVVRPPTVRAHSSWLVRLPVSIEARPSRKNDQPDSAPRAADSKSAHTRPVPETPAHRENIPMPIIFFTIETTRSEGPDVSIMSFRAATSSAAGAASARACIAVTAVLGVIPGAKVRCEQSAGLRANTHSGRSATRNMGSSKAITQRPTGSRGY